MTFFFSFMIRGDIESANPFKDFQICGDGRPGFSYSLADDRPAEECVRCGFSYDRVNLV